MRPGCLDLEMRGEGGSLRMLTVEGSKFVELLFLEGRW